ncbi:hypothetical protein KAFR_0A02710 [Kazachstania africana CBS 2517]|uniref:Uncharacterized protein n=1 Tax=Kazachstania africana (strain ATCC 22294 / BCRC 22015 / CBS 2517 / CECT 1963 / NBRC 1671 / NRRL Y-8276) TaxID=1071382 RepID=H2AMV7_KAZAF|nr:hypothetical protein KAFR_0A02710 [Kazachstania africana CBS 2517]CCF55707.1 hypothetical protein KAFR_0A02710 [Kazachstania africana CBS 2517]
MSLDSVRTTTLPRKRLYPLKMETLPISETNQQKASLSTEANDTDISLLKETSPVIPRTSSSAGTDNDFKFKRHKNKHIEGAPTLGERLDNLQDVKKAKWIENFDSSAPNLTIPQQSTQKHRFETSKTDPGSIPSSQANPDNSVLRSQQPTMNAWPPFYYGVVPYPGSPGYHPQMVPQPFMQLAPPGSSVPSQYYSQSVPMIPSTSIQPLYSASQQSNSELLPAPTLHPNNLQYVQKTRKGRKSLADQRGRRLSIMSNRDQMIISPHRDVPDDQFYRHIGNTSFGEGLQVRQLFNWCAIRSYETLNEGDNTKNKMLDYKLRINDERNSFVDSKKIAMGIIKEFITDLRRGNIDIDWEYEGDDTISNSSEEEVSDDRDEIREDTVLRSLFDEGEGQKERKKKSKRKRLITGQGGDSFEDKYLLPNPKNVENENNLTILTEKVQRLKEGFAQWAKALDQQDPTQEWQGIDEIRKAELKLLSRVGQNHNETQKGKISELEEDIVKRINRMHIHAHLLNSHSNTLCELTGKKLNAVSQAVIENENITNKHTNPKRLLRGLSDSLSTPHS